MEQQVIWLPPLGGDREHGQRRVACATKPKRVWTLYPHTEQPSSPTLPYAPRHNVNAFLEDYVHDWDWRSGTLVYYSRIIEAQQGVWLLLEHER